MQNLASMAVGVAVGAVAVLGVVYGFAASEPGLRTAGVAGEGGEPAAARAPDRSPGFDRSDARLAAVEAKLTDLTEAVRELAERVDRAPSAARRPVVSTPLETAVVDEDSIVRALERVEQKKLEALTFDELMRRAGQNLGEDRHAAGLAIHAALARDLDPEQRARARTQLAMLHRANGDHAESARILQEVVDTAGMHSDEGAGAAYQLVWTRNAEGDHDSAMRLATTLADASRAPGLMRLHARLATGILEHAAGRNSAARAIFQRVEREAVGDPKYRGVLENVRRRLASMGD